MDPKQQLEEFVKLVADMRKAQNEYFKLKKQHISSPEHLEKAKLLEHRVDAFTKAHTEAAAILQKTLFS